MLANGEAPTVIERCTASTGEIQLQRRGEHYELISGGVFLMATYNGESERLLVDAVLRHVERPRRLLVAGLGVGFSLARALESPEVEKVTVVELEPCVIRWNRTHLATYSNHGLDDPRVEVVCADFIEWVKTTATPRDRVRDRFDNHLYNRFDGICIDIDNGPAWTVNESNRWLYSDQGLVALKRLLNPGGAVSFWSAASAPDFAEQLRRQFTSVSHLRATQQRGGPDYVYLARQARVDAAS